MVATKQRKKIGLQMTTMEVVTTMSEGNPGAITVIMELLKKDPMNLMVVLDLDDMGMRGSQIWIAYKDHCGQDIGKLIECCRSRDKAMVATVNRECPDRVAVAHGASS